MTQKDHILNHIITHGGITPLDALIKYGCFRLASRINELRHDGVNIVTNIETRTNANGDKTSFALYRIRRDA